MRRNHRSFRMSSPLSISEIYIDKCWTLKCCIVMHMLANVISMDNTTSLIKKILNNVILY